MGFSDIKSKVIVALDNGSYLHESRSDINVKNLLATGQVSAEQVRRILGNCTSQHCQTSPHDRVPSVDVHVIKKDGWYIKFYFVDPDTMFISVHQ